LALSCGLDILERTANAGVFGAKRELAIAIRKNDPVRARALLEESRRPDPGGAVVPLAQMLIAGEGGPADPKGALSLLRGASDNWMADGMRGQLTLEGRLMPRNVQEAVRLLDIAGTYDFKARIQVLGLLAANPGGADQQSQARAPRCGRGRGTGRAGRYGRADRPKTLAKRPVSGPARSL
jgi:hypothetical protein